MKMIVHLMETESHIGELLTAIASYAKSFQALPNVITVSPDCGLSKMLADPLNVGQMEISFRVDYLSHIPYGIYMAIDDKTELIIPDKKYPRLFYGRKSPMNDGELRIRIPSPDSDDNNDSDAFMIEF